MAAAVIQLLLATVLALEKLGLRLGLGLEGWPVMWGTGCKGEAGWQWRE